MALSAKSLHDVKAMDAEQRTAYFEDYARFIPDAPKMRYAIRVGSRTLMSDDVFELRLQFDKLLS